MMDPTWLAIPFGMVFGFAYMRGRMARCANMPANKFLLIALTVAMITLYALSSVSTVQFPDVPVTVSAANLIGGLVFGMGMAIAGYFPGVLTHGVSEGQMDYLISGALGLLAVILAYGTTYLQVFPAVAKIAYIGPKTLPDMLAVNPFILIAIIVVAVVLGFYFLERGHVRKESPKQRPIKEAARTPDLQPE